MTKIIHSKVAECIYPLKKICRMTFCWIFLADFSSQRGLSRDPTVWLDGAWPNNTCTPPSSVGKGITQLFGIPTPKVHLQVWKNSKFWQNHFFIKKLEKVLAIALWVRVNLPNVKFGGFTYPTVLASAI